ncbi:hypothetical protein [Devosia sp.]
MQSTLRFLAIGGLLAAFGFVGVVTARAHEATDAGAMGTVVASQVISNS